jgi:hypothetical protein
LFECARDDNPGRHAAAFRLPGNPGVSTNKARRMTKGRRARHFRVAPLPALPSVGPRRARCLRISERSSFFSRQ